MQMEVKGGNFASKTHENDIIIKNMSATIYRIISKYMINILAQVFLLLHNMVVYKNIVPFTV